MARLEHDDIDAICAAAEACGFLGRAWDAVLLDGMPTVAAQVPRGAADSDTLYATLIWLAGLLDGNLDRLHRRVHRAMILSVPGTDGRRSRPGMPPERGSRQCSRQAICPNHDGRLQVILTNPPLIEAKTAID